jgi:Uncharacterised nucleotidyltransferase
MNVRPEVELLLCCARTTIESHVAEQIRTLVRQQIDWDYLVRIASFHQVIPLLHSTFHNTISEECPRAVLRELKFISIASVARNLFLTQELIKLLRFFESQGIQVIPYKGPVLAAVAYREPVLRSFGDLDIFVHKWDYYLRIGDLLTSRGWRRGSDWWWEKESYDPSSGVTLDVHEGITPKEMPFRFDFYRAWKRCVTVCISGTYVRTFAPADLLIILCVQMAKDVAFNMIRLSKICDIAELVRNYENMDWEWVFREAKSLGALGMLHIGLRAATDLLGIAVPKDILEKSRNGRDLDSLVVHVKECTLSGGTNTYSRPELLNASRFNYELRERVRDRLSYIYFVTPHFDDFSFVRLPRAFSSLYYIVKPVRLTYKHIRILTRTMIQSKRRP